MTAAQGPAHAQAQAQTQTRTPRKRAAFEPPSRLLAPVHGDPHMRRPTTTTTGAALVLLRAVAGVLVMLGIWLRWPEIVQDAELVLDGDPVLDAAQLALWATLAVMGTGALLDLVLVFFVWRGSNFARIFVMVFAVISVSTTFTAWWAHDQEITVSTSLLAVGLDVLILLALSSRSAAAYARRNQPA